MDHDQKAPPEQLGRALDYVRLLKQMRAKIPLYGEETLDEIFRRWKKLRSPHLTLTPQPHDPTWPRRFAEERERIRQALPGQRPAIQHFGSTSIPGLASKRVIDLSVAVESLDGVEGRLVSLGYEDYGNSPVDTETTWLWRTDETGCVFVAHLCRQGRPWLQRAADFRDFLIAHPEEIERYLRLKERLAVDSAGDSLRYSLGKIELFHEIFTRAAAWRAAGAAAKEET